MLTYAQPAVIVLRLVHIGICLFNSIMYTIQYWNARSAEWKGTGTRPMSTWDAAREELAIMRSKCDGIVMLRIKQEA